MSKRIVFFVLSSLLSAAWAAEPVPVPDPPPPPPVMQSGEVLQPDEITIRRQDKRTVYEYKIDGRTYMVRIVPQGGAPYYLLDSDGDGEFDVRRPDPAIVPVQQWLLFSW